LTDCTVQLLWSAAINMVNRISPLDWFTLLGIYVQECFCWLVITYVHF
jgi:hypothetical protein